MSKFDEFAWLSSVSTNLQKKRNKKRFLETGCDDGNKMEQISLNLVIYLILLCFTCILYR